MKTVFRFLSLGLLAVALLVGGPADSYAQKGGATETRISVADYQADIDELERRLLDQSSYLQRRDFDHKTAFTTLRQSTNDQTELPGFVRALQKLIMQIGDCHADVVSPVPLPESNFLPFRSADTADGVTALGINQDQPLDAEYPYLESIDGAPLGEWLEAAARFVARASPQLTRRRSLDWMGKIELMRAELNLPASESVTVGLKSADGSRQTTKRLRPTKQRYSVAELRLRPTRLLDGNIGYLRIPTMDDRLVESLVADIKSFRNTHGLIIDVRDNGGGTYGVMRGIYGFFVPDDAKPKVTNIAAYRLSPTFPRNHIEYRPTFRADWEGWNEHERETIREAAAKFKPEWILPDGKFSEWHYMILSRERSGRGGPSQRIVAGISNDYFFYDKPVVVLSNAGSFSAADGFVNAFGDLPQVTVVGEPSAGGSGATRSFRLPKTRITVALASMASFRPNGKLFDGNGIEVDVPAKPSLDNFTGGHDSVLARAIEVIKEKAR